MAKKSENNWWKWMVERTGNLILVTLVALVVCLLIFGLMIGAGVLCNYLEVALPEIAAVPIITILAFSPMFILCFIVHPWTSKEGRDC